MNAGTIFEAFVLATAVLALSGCVVVNGKHTYWDHAYEPFYERGPGTEDARFEQYSYNKYQSDDGKHIAIGLFPGYAALGRTNETNRAVVNQNVAEWAAFTVLGNYILLGIPTLYSLVAEPFKKDSFSKDGSCDMSANGLIGCCRWREAPQETQVLKKTKEERIVRAREGADYCGFASPSAQAMDRTMVYFDYPGFNQVFSQVREKGRVDVLFSNGGSVRRFSKAKHVKNALVYEDWDVSDDTRLKGQVDFIVQCRAFKRRLQTAAGMERDAGKREFINAAITEVNDALVSKSIADSAYRSEFDERMKEISRILEGKDSAPAPTPARKPSSPDNHEKTVEKSEFDL